MKISIQNHESPRVSIIITSNTRQDLLLPCLKSIESFGPPDIPYEIVVMLNGVERTVEKALKGVAPGIAFCRSDINLGFGGANNRARLLCRGEFIVTLNDDVEIERGWLETLVRTADENPQAGAIGGMVLYMDGRLQNAGMILWQDAITSPPWTGHPPPPETFDRVRAVDYCGTNSLLVRSAAWDRLGGLDERYFPLYYTDVDLCMGLRQIGFVTLFQPAARVRHHRGSSTSNHFKPFITARNRLIFMDKWKDKLLAHEPADREWTEGIQRAIARAERTAEILTQDESLRVCGPTETPDFDFEEQDRRQLERARSVQKDYVTFLEGKLDAAGEAQPRRRKMSDRIMRELRRAFGRIR